MRDVIIIGSGIAGSSLATVLGNLGWDVLLLERHHFPRHKVCGEFLSPESQASLKAMGLYDMVKALSPQPMQFARFVSQQGVSASFPLPGTAWGISRFALDSILAMAANRAGAEVRTGVTATSVEETGNGYQVELRTREGYSQVQARAAIVACGRHPMPGLRPDLQPTRQSPSYVGVKGHYEGVRMPPQVEIYLFDGGYTGVDVIEDDRVNICVLVKREVLRRRGSSIRSMLEESIQWNPALRERMAGGVLLHETEVAVAAVDMWRAAAPWGRAARIGDAAAMIPPFTGDGMAMALRSAEIAAPLVDQFLAGRLSRPMWEQAHCSTWHREFDQPLWIARQIHQVLDMPVLADAFLTIGRMVPPLATGMVRATRSTIRPLHSITTIVP